MLLDGGESCPFLPSVMLFLHQQVELIEPVHPGTVLFLIVRERFQEPYESYPAFMFEWFHRGLST